MEEWTRPGKIGNKTGEFGAPSSHIWEYTLSYRVPHFKTRSAACQDLEACRKQNILVGGNKSNLAPLKALSLPLAR